MKTILILGATGQVGNDLLQLALSLSHITRVIAPTRSKLPTHEKLFNPLVDFENLSSDASWWQADFALCALGTTLRKAGSEAKFYRVDHDYVVSAATISHRAGTPTFGLVSSLGANKASKQFYQRVKGETEQDVAAIGFKSLTIARPSLLLTDVRTDSRPIEQIGQWLGRYLKNVIPQKYRPVETAQVARALIEAGMEAPTGIHYLESETLIRF